MSSRHDPASGPVAPAAVPHRIRDGLVAAIGAASAMAVLFGHRTSPAGAVALSGVVAVSTWLAIIDFREHRLPNRIVGPLAAAVTVGVVVAGAVDGDLGRTGRAIGLGLAVVAVLLVANLVGGLGMGDVKYGFPVGVAVGWFGWDALSVTVLATTISGAIVAIAMLVRGRGRNQHLSYGPYMAIGLVAGLLVAAPW